MSFHIKGKHAMLCVAMSVVSNYSGSKNVGIITFYMKVDKRTYPLLEWKFDYTKEHRHEFRNISNKVNDKNIPNDQIRQLRSEITRIGEWTSQEWRWSVKPTSILLTDFAATNWGMRNVTSKLRNVMKSSVSKHRTHSSRVPASSTPARDYLYETVSSVCESAAIATLKDKLLEAIKACNTEELSYGTVPKTLNAFTGSW